MSEFADVAVLSALVEQDGSSGAWLGCETTEHKAEQEETAGSGRDRSESDRVRRTVEEQDGAAAGTALCCAGKDLDGAVPDSS